MLLNDKFCAQYSHVLLNIFLFIIILLTKHINNNNNKIYYIQQLYDLRLKFHRLINRASY